MAKPKGIVYLVGAGPGDPGLITLKGKKCVETVTDIISEFLIELVENDIDEFYQ